MELMEQAKQKVTDTVKSSQLLDIPIQEAMVAHYTPYEEVKVVRRVTAKNFWKNPRFWVTAGTVIGSAIAGNHMEAINAAISLFGAM